MKVNEILIEATADKPQEFTVGELLYDPHTVSRDGLRMPGSLSIVAPDGKAPKEWEHNDDFRIKSELRVTSLKGCPQIVKDTFDYQAYSDTVGASDLVGGPIKARSYSVSADTLTSLKGAPRNVTYFTITARNLTSLKYSPAECSSYSLYDCNNITSLEDITPKMLRLSLSGCKNLTSLKNIHKQINSLEMFVVHDDMKIKSHVLGLLLIPNMKEIIANDKDFKAVADIMNKYFWNNARGKDAVLECQNELIDAGLDEYAQL